MRNNKALLALSAVLLPLASVVLLESTAVAKHVTGSGTVTCHVSGTLTFNPPLTPSGTAVKKEIITVSTSAVNCSGGTPTASPGSTATKPVKVKSTTKPPNSGSCAAAASQTGPGTTVKGKQNWGGGVKPSKFLLTGVKFGLDSGTGEVDETGSVTTTGSYAGSGTVHIDFNSSSSSALLACVGGTSSTPISSVTIDPANSTIGE
jgi:hypothetical protein